MLLCAGIPMNTLKVIRPVLEAMCRKPLAPHKQLIASEYLGKILIEEVATQLEDLRGKIVFLCFDATPRMGYVFALVVCYVDTTVEGTYYDAAFETC
jgi:hypothetical protein